MFSYIVIDLKSVNDAVTLEGSTTGQNGIKDCAEAVDVRRNRDRAATAQRLLGRHGGGRTHDRA